MFRCNDDNGKHLDAFIKNIPLTPETAYRLTVDHCGGAFGIWVNRGLVEKGGGPHYFDHCGTWTTHEIRFITAANTASSAALENWSISFFKKFNSLHITGMYDTHIDNVRLVSETEPDRNLLSGGDFEAPLNSPFYAKHWGSILQGGASKVQGVTPVPDPLRPNNRCLLLPKLTRPPHYPETVALQVEGFGQYSNELNFHFHRAPDGLPHHLLLLSENGEIKFLPDDTYQAVPSGSVVHIPPHTPLDYRFDRGKNTAFYWVTFSGVIADELLKHMAITNAVVTLPRLSELTAHIDKMLQLPTDTATYPYAISAHLQLLLTEIGEQLIPESQNVHKQLIDRIALRLREQPEEPLDNAALAEECGFSVGHFIRLFKQYTGRTPHQYHLHALVKKSCTLLRDTTLTIQEISFALGIENPLYFSRLFRSVQGVSPREYRKQQ